MEKKMSITYEREEEMLMHARIQTSLLQQLVELMGKQINPKINPYNDTGFAKMYEDSSNFKLNNINDEIRIKRKELFRQNFLAYFSDPLEILNDEERTELSEECHKLSDEYEERWGKLVESGEIDASVEGLYE
jgi:hypothetical protein